MAKKVNEDHEDQTESIKNKIEECDKEFDSLMREIDKNLEGFARDDLTLYGVFTNKTT